MAFCKSCGKEIQEGNAFCQHCGAPVEVTAEAANTEATNAEAGAPVEESAVSKAVTETFNNVSEKIKQVDFKAEAKKLTSNKKVLSIVGGVVAAIVLIIIIVKIAGAGAPENQVKKAVKLLSKQSTSYDTIYYASLNEYKATVSKQHLEIMLKCDDAEYDNLKEYAKEKLEDAIDNREDYYGDDCKFTFTPKKTKDIKKNSDKFDRCEDYWDNYVDSLESNANYYEKASANHDDECYDKLAEMYDKYADKYGKLKVTAVKEVTGKLVVSGDDEKRSDNVTFYFAKVGGKWICLSGDLSGYTY